MIQPFETATVRAIHVADGQAVKAGDVLIELDATSTTADTTRTANDLVTARLQGARARAMLAALAGGRLPPLGAVAGAGPERLAQEQHVLDGQYGEYRARLARIDADVAKREAELRSTREIVRKLEQTVPIARRRAQDFKDLVEKNFVSRHGYLEKEQARIEQEADLATPAEPAAGARRRLAGRARSAPRAGGRDAAPGAGQPERGRAEDDDPRPGTRQGRDAEQADDPHRAGGRHRAATGRAYRRRAW